MSKNQKPTKSANGRDNTTGTVSLRGVFTWSLRAHWSILYPWALVAGQAVMIIVLLVTLQRDSVRPIQQCNRDLRKEKVSSGQTHDGRLSNKFLTNLVKDVHIDDRITKALPVPAEIKEISNPQRIFFNRVPKCGTHTLIDVIMEMARVHNFSLVRSEVYMRFDLEKSWQQVLASRFMQAPTPLLFERHLHFMRFDRFDAKQPMYFNIIRDPLERMVSWYYFRRFQYGHERDMPLNKRIRSFDECVFGNYSECVDPMGNEPEEGYFKIIPFFCGQDDVCRTDSDLALGRAVQNVRDYYAVVGVTEYYSRFIQVLEYILPSYFAGMSKVYAAQDTYFGRKHKTENKLPVSREAVQIMFPKLAREYKFYNFIKARFHKLYKELTLAREKYEGPS